MPASVLKSTVDVKSPAAQKNHRRIVDLLTSLKNQEEQICGGGGPKAIESQHKKGRLTGRERVKKLVDPGSHFFELGIYAAHEMYEEWGGAPGAGVITGLARVSGRTFMLIVNDATVKAGAFFPMTAKKVIRAQNIAIENRIPTIYLVDSAGIFLPAAGRRLSRHRRFRPRLPQQRRHERHGHPANHRHHGHVRRRRRVSSRDVRSHPDDRGLRPLPRRSRARPSRHRPEILPPKNSAAPGCIRRSAAPSISASPTTTPASNASAPSSTKWARRILRPFSHAKSREPLIFRRRNLQRLLRRSRQAIRHARDHRAHRGRQRVRRVPRRIRRNPALRLRAHRRLGRRHRRQPEETRADHARRLRPEAHRIRRRHLHRVAPKKPRASSSTATRTASR